MTKYYGNWHTHDCAQVYRHPDMVECLVYVLTENMSDEDARILHTKKYLLDDAITRTPDRLNTRSRRARLAYIRQVADRVHYYFDEYPVDYLVKCIDRAIFDAWIMQMNNCEPDTGNNETWYSRQMLNSLLYGFGPESLTWTEGTTERYDDDEQPYIEVKVLADQDDALQILSRAKELYAFYDGWVLEVGHINFFDDRTTDTQVSFRYYCG